MADKVVINRDYVDAFSFKQDAIDTIVPKYFSDEVSDLNVGLKGYVTELVGHVAEDTYNTISTLFVEQFPNRAQIPESIYSHAAIFQLSDTFGTAAYSKFLLILKEDELKKYAENNYSENNENKDYIVIHISGNTQIHVEDIIFTLDYPIEIRGKRKKNNEFQYTASYMMSEESKPDTWLNYNSFSNINSPHIRVRKSIGGYIGLEVEAHQLVKYTQDENIVSNNTINYPVFTVFHDEQLAGMDVFYKAPSSDNWQLLEKRIIYSTPSKNPFLYYTKTDDSTVSLSFSTRDYYFQPEFNSKIKINYYTTSGSAGNFVNYKGNNIAVVADSTDYKYNSGLTMVAAVLSSSSGGLDVISLTDLQALTVESYSSATEISTDYDLEKYYYNYKHRYNDEIMVIKRRDDASERLFSAFLIMKDGDDIYKTNTLQLQVSESQFEKVIYDLNPNDDDYNIDDASNHNMVRYRDGINNTYNTMIIKPGELMEYRTDSSLGIVTTMGETVYDMVENDIYDDIYYFSTGLNYFKKNDMGTYDYYNGKYNTIVVLNMSATTIESIIDQQYLTKHGDKYVENAGELYWLEEDNHAFSLWGKGTNKPLIESGNGTTDTFTFTIIAGFEEDGCVKKSSIKDYVYTNPFLMMISKNPNNVSYYLTMTNQLYALDFSYTYTSNLADTEMIPNFIASQIRVRRDMYPKNIYTISCTVACSLSSIPDVVPNKFDTENSLVINGNLIDDSEATDVVKDNPLRVIAVMSDKNGKEVCFVEMYPIQYVPELYTDIELQGPNMLFVGHFKTDDVILSDNRFRMLKEHVYSLANTQLTEYCYIPMEDVNVTIYTLYKTNAADISAQKYATFKPSLSGYMVTDYYKTKSEPVTFIKPMNMMRSTLSLSSDGDDCVFNVSLVPLVKYNLLNDEVKFDTFITNLVNQYQYLEDSIDILRNNTNIDIKFYNTYGRSRNLYIGDDYTLLDKVNISITFSIIAVYGTNVDLLETRLKTFIKEYIEEINKDGKNYIYISNLMREVENNFAEVHHMKFIGINNFDSTFQSVYNKIVDINDLPKSERRNYVPEIVVVDEDNVNLAMSIDQTGVDDD